MSLFLYLVADFYYLRGIEMERATQEAKEMLKQARRTYQNCSELLVQVEKGDYSQISILSDSVVELDALANTLYSKSSLCDAIVNKFVEWIMIENLN